MAINNSSNVGKVILERFGSVAQLTLSRPKALNALTWEMYQQLEDHLKYIADDDTIRVLVIRGEGKALAAGTDIKQFKNFTGQDGIDYEKKIDKITNELERLPKPTIAAVHGYAIGGGMILASACDLRYATPEAYFGAPMAKTLGNCLSLDNYKRLSKELGNMRTKEIIYTARLIDSQEAASINFVTDIFESGVFFNKVLEIANTIGEQAQTTIGATKEAFNRINNDLAASTQSFDDVLHMVYGSDDFAEGVDAHIKKRSPVWKKNK